MTAAPRNVCSYLIVSLITVCVLFVCMYDYCVSGSLVRVQLYSCFDNVILAGDCMYVGIPHTHSSSWMSACMAAMKYVPAGPSALELLLLLSSEILQPMFL